MAQASSPPPTNEPHADVPLAEHFIFGILGLGIVNGIFSPVLGIVFLLHPFWYPSIFLPLSAPFIMMLASLLTSTLTIMLAGIPAALYERFFNRGRTNEISLWIWVSALAVLSVPAVLRAINAL